MNTGSQGFYACVIFLKYSTTRCSGADLYVYDSWVNIATNVLDGTKFRIRVTVFQQPRYISAILDF